ncbi:STAS/SEC14 domain-containing protein [Alkalicoccus saliphilus]|jgi:hypothetical protein|uniref:STAS/SEC14 domain-containing protein n=1 Tax=Alkalicoccus saliphilus TaxID=200989 RepID=A0A2T4U9T6_9BACI|nr:STAS/SEC14 domain-containing protein [Alkalicoccus saliphilus]PTL40157.1 hypothetical protein C6Y45_01900 [Alkalicoccus saliphilus]
MLKKLSTSEGDILEYEIEGKISAEEEEEMLKEVRRLIETHGKIRMLEYTEKMPTGNLSSFKDYFGFLKDDLKNVEKYALVTDSSAASGLVKAGDAFTKANFRTFGTEDLEKAREWLRQPSK